MKKLIIFIILFVNLYAINLTQQEKEYIKNKKVILVHNELEWAPYNFNEKGVPKGFVIDYMNLIAKKVGLKIKYINGYTWSEFLELIKQNKIDVIGNIAKTPSRQKYILFTKPFLESKKAIFSNIPDMRKISDLNGKKVAVVNKFFIHEYLKTHYPKIKIKTYKNIKECLYAVINKEADALIENYAVVNYLIIKNGLTIKYIAITDDKELKTKISIGIAKNEPILKNILQKAQLDITKDEFERLENKWFGIINEEIMKLKGITIYDKLITPNLTKKEKEFIHKKKKIKICVGSDWMPFEKIDKNGNYIGIINDYTKLILGKVDLSYEVIKTKDFKEQIKFLKNNKCQLIMADVATDEMKKLFFVTKPYLIVPRAFVTHEDTPWVSNFAYLLEHNNKVGVIANTPSEQILKKRYKNIQIIPFKDTKSGLKAVSSKKIIAFVNIMPTIAYTMQTNIFSDIKIAGYIKDDIKLSIFINKNYPLLKPILNKAIDSITEQERLDIFSKWIKVKFEKNIDYKYIIKIVAILILIILLILYINYKLKQRIKEEIEKNRQKDKQLLEQSRLAQMGEMIAMIAHQWRQPLTAINATTNSIILKTKLKKLDEENLIKLLNKILFYTKHLNTTIDDFRNFFKPNKEKIKVTYTKVIEDVLNIISATLENKNIKLQTKLNSNIEFYTYENELKQAILNIIKNAEDALIENNIQNPIIKISSYYNKLIIQDNAGGIPEDIIDKIFDPYFSTKDKNGTGIGLYMTKIIIDEHLKGKIEVYNEDNGAVFKITLPKEDT